MKLLMLFPVVLLMFAATMKQAASHVPPALLALKDRIDMASRRSPLLPAAENRRCPTKRGAWPAAFGPAN